MNGEFPAFMGGILTMLVAVAIAIGAYGLGYSSGKNEVVSACSYYKKYALDGTQYLLCSAVVKQDTTDSPSVAETNAKLYSEENKDAHKKDRK